MTADTTTVCGPQPTPVDLDQARTDLVTWQRGRETVYPYLLGVAQTLLDLISEAHIDCRTSGCVICRHLRRATAIRIAVTEAGA
jgi:hypothetical protein